MKRTSLRAIKAIVSQRKPGYLEACLKFGRQVSIDNDVKIELDDDKYQQIQRDFMIRPVIKPSIPGIKVHTPPPRFKGAGDLVEAGLKPFAKLSDRFLGTKLVGCKGCGERRDALNKAIPFNK